MSKGMCMLRLCFPLYFGCVVKNLYSLFSFSSIWVRRVYLESNFMLNISYNWNVIILNTFLFQFNISDDLILIWHTLQDLNLFNKQLLKEHITILLGLLRDHFSLWKGNSSFSSEEYAYVLIFLHWVYSFAGTFPIWNFI